jgi:hypothetical protein
MTAEFRATETTPHPKSYGLPRADAATIARIYPMSERSPVNLISCAGGPRSR